MQILRHSLIITGLFVGRLTVYCRNSCFQILLTEEFMDKPGKITPPKGKLGILTPGMGAVSTTFMSGVELVRRGKAQPIGSLTQLGTIRLGKRTDGRSPLIKKFVPLGELNDLVFGGWDIFRDNAYESAANAGVLNPQDLAKVKTFLSGIKPMKAVFDPEYVKK
ncbi:MAG: inositol-3-phosphate synthase, partial [Candidatus Acidiferrum sp.]